MNDFEIDRLLGLAQPGPAPALTEAGQELLEEIVSTSSGEDIRIEKVFEAEVVEIPVGRSAPLRGRRGPSRWLVGVAAAVAVALAVALPMLLFDRGQNEGAPASVSPVESVNAEGNPLLILDVPGWSFESLSQVDGEGGMAFYGPGASRLTLNWGSAGIYSELYDAQMQNFDPPSVSSPLTVLGSEGTLFERSDGAFVVMMLPADSKTYLQLFAQGVKSRDDFVAVVQDLRAVGESEWIDSLPDDAVLPDESVEVAQQMLSDVPVPAGLQAKDFEVPFARDYYRHALDVMDPVSCSLASEYEDARKAGDAARLTEAGQALSGSRDWAVLKKMKAIEDDQAPFGWGEGEGVAQIIWNMADVAADGGDLTSLVAQIGCE